jgi:cell division protein ZapA
MKQVEVSILGQVYVLGCPEGGEALLASAVASVDREMTTIRDGGKVKARERIAVLAALNLAYMLAERGPASSAPTAPVAAAVSASSAAAADLGHHQADLDGLMRRVEQALNDDGQLL